MGALHPADFAARVRAEPPTSAKRLKSGISGAYLATWRDGLKAVVKTSHKRLPNGQTAQRGIPAATHPFREVAFFQLAEALGWADLVPATCLFDFEGRPASAQAFVSAALHFADFKPEMAPGKVPVPQLFRAVAAHVPIADWRRLVCMDLIAGSRDRHANNVGLRLSLHGDRAVYSLVAWDNAVCFGDAFTLYRNVPHKRVFFKSFDLDPAWDVLSSFSRPQLESAVGGHLRPWEVSDAWTRLQFVLEFSYKMPYEVFSKGRPSADFPAYSSYFARHKNHVAAQTSVFV